MTTPNLWVRDASGTIVCACGHLSTEHRHDLTKSSPCARGACGCNVLRPASVMWREHRTVIEPITEG